MLTASDLNPFGECRAGFAVATSCSEYGAMRKEAVRPEFGRRVSYQGRV